MKERIKRVNNLIKEELGKIIFKEIEFPKEILVTLTRIETSKDFSEAKVYITCYPEDKEREILKILNSRIYFIQKKLDKKLVMRKIPKIVFVKEETVVQAGKIEKILEELKKKKK